MNRQGKKSILRLLFSPASSSSDSVSNPSVGTQLLATVVVNLVTEPAIRLERVVDVDVDDLCSNYYCCYYFSCS